MASERKEKWSEQTYRAIQLFGVSLIVILVASEVVKVAVYVLYMNCNLNTWLNDGYKPAPTSTCAASQLYPYWSLMIPGIIFGIMVASWASRRREYWFREVRSGRIVGFLWHSSSNFLTSGHSTYGMTIRGNTRHGEVREYSYSIPPKEYFDYQIGDKINLD